MYQIVLTIQVLFGYVTISQTLSTVPETSFSCEGRIAGYYADPETGCQSYHMCDSRARKYSYLCPNLTLFHQKFLVCDHWNSVECGKSEDYYFLNEEIAGLRVQDVNDVDNTKQAQAKQDKASAAKEPSSQRPLNANGASTDLSLPGIRVENAVKTDILDQVVGPKLFSPIAVTSNSFSLAPNISSAQISPVKASATTERTLPKDNPTSIVTTTVISQTPSTTPSKLTTTEKRNNTNRAFFAFTKASPIAITQSTRFNAPTPDPIKSLNLTVPSTKPEKILPTANQTLPAEFVTRSTPATRTISDKDFTTNLPLYTVAPVKLGAIQESLPENSSNVDFINLSDGSFVFQFPEHESTDVELLGPNRVEIPQSVSEDLHEKAHTSDFYSLLGMKNFFHSTLDQLSWILPQSRSKQPRLTVVFNRPNTPPLVPVQKHTEQDHKDPSGKHIKQESIKHKATMKFQLKTKSSVKNAHCPECHPSFIVSDCFPCISIR